MTDPGRRPPCTNEQGRIALDGPAAEVLADAQGKAPDAELGRRVERAGKRPPPGDGAGDQEVPVAALEQSFFRTKARFSSAHRRAAPRCRSPETRWTTTSRAGIATRAG